MAVRVIVRVIVRVKMSAVHETGIAGAGMNTKTTPFVIPGRCAAPDPESISPVLRSMDSGFATSWRPGMTAL